MKNLETFQLIIIAMETKLMEDKYIRFLSSI